MYMNIHLCTVADHHTVRLYIPMHSRKKINKTQKQISPFPHLSQMPFDIQYRLQIVKTHYISSFVQTHLHNP